MLKTITPIDNTIYVEREFATSDAIDNALALSKKALIEWRHNSLEERKVALFLHLIPLKLIIKMLDYYRDIYLKKEK